jgi:hypothetical protein
MRYSTGCVRDYIANGCGGPDLPLTIPEGANIRFWYNLGGFQLFTRWENGDVWGSDFRDGPDLAADGGSDVPELYFSQVTVPARTLPVQPAVISLSSAVILVSQM